VPAAGQQRTALLSSIAQRDVDTTVKVSTDKIATGGNHWVYLVARQSSAGEYRGSLRMAATGAVYLQVTRGVAPRTHYFPPASTPPTVFMSTSTFTPNHEQRERGASAVTYPDIRWSRCDLKTVNLLGAVLAKQHAVAAGSLEAVFIRDGVITEGSHTNVFGVIDSELRTYPRSNYILPGITRDVVLELAVEQGITVRETPILQHEIGRLDELFITGTTSDVTPIVQLDGRPIGSAEPGRITRTLAAALERRLYASKPVGDARLAAAR